MVEGFVVTTLDSAVRLCRYLLEEFWRFAFAGAPPSPLRNIYVNSGFAVALMLAFSVSGTRARCGPSSAPAITRRRAALTTVSVWLAQRARRRLFALLPAVFMIGTTIAALWIQVERNLTGANPVLGFTAAALLLLAAGVVAIGTARFADAVQGHARRPMVAVSD